MLRSPLDSPREACGVIGIWEPTGAVSVPDYLVIGLTELQHRGQESAGIAICAGGAIRTRVGMGKVREVFPRGARDLQAPVGIGHVRYSTTGSSAVHNAGPFLVGQHGRSSGQVALAHNGNISNSEELRALLGDAVEPATTDSEMVAHLLHAAEGATFEERLRSVLPLLRGAYSFVILTGGRLYGLRDPLGMRPLLLGRLGRGWVLASESGAIEKLGGAIERDIRPGELLEIGPEGVRSVQLTDATRHAFCCFEYIYFAGAASVLGGRPVYAVRQALGRELAREHPVLGADVVSGVPHSAVPAAIAYAAELGLPYTEALLKSRYADRSFIKPDQRLRQLEIDLMFSIVRSNVEGKSIVLVDDSIVRGNTMRRAIAAIRNHGAREVHLRITSPPLRNPCYYGIDIRTDQELIATRASVEEIGAYLGADSLGYLSLDGLAHAISGASVGDAGERFHVGHCYGCLDRRGYPYSTASAWEAPAPSAEPSTVRPGDVSTVVAQGRAGP